MNPLHIFAEIGKGFEWFGKEIGKAFVDLPKILTLTDDAERAATTALPEAVAVIEDAGALVAATVKDSGVFLASLGALSAAIAKAIGDKALNVTEDVAVAAAFEAFCKAFTATNVADMLSAWKKLAADTQTLDTTVVETLKKLEQDVGA